MGPGRIPSENTTLLTTSDEVTETWEILVPLDEGHRPFASSENFPRFGCGQVYKRHACVL